MANPLYQEMNSKGNDFVSQFQTFRRNFQGNPQQQIQQMLTSGRISQAQYNAAVQKANMLRRLLGI